MKTTRQGKTSLLAAAIIGALITTGLAAERWRVLWDPLEEPPPTNHSSGIGYLVRWSGQSRTSATYRGRTGEFRIPGRLSTSSPVFSNVSLPIFVIVQAYTEAGIEGPESDEVVIPETTRTSTNLLSPVAIKVTR